jgi:hypothetical protein
MVVPHLEWSLPANRRRSRRLIEGQMNGMVRRIPTSRTSLGPGLELVLVVGAAHFAWEHEQGRHTRPHVLCLICWLNEVTPDPDASDGSGPAGPPEQA